MEESISAAAGGALNSTNIIVNIPELTPDEGNLSKMTPGTPLSPQFNDSYITPVQFQEDLESNNNIVFKVKVNTKKENN
jgi:hypothetical protein